MYEDKVYKGEQYSFRRKKDFFAHGGNGQIYDVILVDSCDTNNYVAKFFRGKTKDNIRYNRFKKEASFVYSKRDIDGIMPIIDKFCPDLLRNNRSE